MHWNNTTYQSQLNQLLAKSPETLAQQLNSNWPSLTENTPFVLFGAGQLGQFIASHLRHELVNHLIFADDTPDLQGKKILGIKVNSIQSAIQKYGNCALFIVCIMNEKHRYCDSQYRLRKFGAKRIISFQQLAYHYPDQLLPWYQFDYPSELLSHREKLIHIFSLLGDKTSQRHFISLLKNRLLIQLHELETVEYTYFQDDLFDIKTIDCYVDCGAFDGDTIETFTKINHVFSKIIAFEPDKINFKKLSSRIEHYHASIKSKIVCHNLAVANKNGKSYFKSAQGAASSLSEKGDIEVSTCSLDKLLQNVKVDFIKFDIEGAEQAALSGAINIIAHSRPILAISSYHLPNDIWQIPLWIEQHCPHYKLAFRLEGTDGLGGVIYGIPDKQ